MVRLDQFISGIRDGLILQDNDFELLDYDRLGNVISVKYKGVYVIVDNGYLQWSCTVPPFTVTSDMDEIRWSKWLESMRKDVECTFGILKGRWRILKSGICIEGVDAVDKVWLTCCALHNWLLEIDFPRFTTFTSNLGKIAMAFLIDRATSKPALHRLPPLNFLCDFVPIIFGVKCTPAT